MSDIKTKNLKVQSIATDFGIVSADLIEALGKNGFTGLNRNSTLTDEQYEVVLKLFKKDKDIKEKTEVDDIFKNSPFIAIPKIKKDDEPILSFKTDVKKKNEPLEKSGINQLIVNIAEENKQDELHITETENKNFNIQAPTLPGLKVVNKIDLEKRNEVSKKEVENTPAKPNVINEDKKNNKIVNTDKQVDTSAKILNISRITTLNNEDTTVSNYKPQNEQIDIIKPAIIEKNEPLIENIQAKKIEGPKILRTIELPKETDSRQSNNVKDKDNHNKKRKRIVHPQPKPPNNNINANKSSVPFDHKKNNQQPSSIYPKNNPSNNNHQNKRYVPPVSVKSEIDEKVIQDKIKETQAKLAIATGRGKSSKAKYRRAKKEELAENAENNINNDHILQVTEFLTVSELANLMNISFAEVIAKCMNLGIMATINQRLDAEVIELVANEFKYEVQFVSIDETDTFKDEDEFETTDELQITRPPIVTIMGHVDHGKTSLLDYIRNTNVVAGEAGGITQHIGAYVVQINEKKSVTFLDTPGHEAFTSMRARGAKITDIAIIVVAADDAVMPQTKEAINHAQAASVPIIIAVNKIDKESANPKKVYEQLSQMNILVEAWGGKYQNQEISAKKGINIDLLIEKILLEAELLELKANPNKPASGTVIEASLDKGRGNVATILIQDGSLHIGDTIVSGQYFGRIKAMFNERNHKIEEALPATPVVILGLNGAPQAGEKFKVYTDETKAKDIANKRAQLIREQGLRTRKHITLDEIGRRLALGNFKELNIIIKGDVDGSVEAMSDSLQKLSTEEIAVRVIHKGVGQISESDVLLAAASDAILIGFNVRPSAQAHKLSQLEGVEVKLYSIIYTAIEEVKSAMEGLLEPTIAEKITANVAVKEVYKFDKASVAGCYVLDGKIFRNSKIRIIRDGIVIFPKGEGQSGELGSLKRFKEDVKEVNAHLECGLIIKNFNDLKQGDVVEVFEIEEIKRTL